MRSVPIIALVLLATSPAMSVDTRDATEDEIAKALVGCWNSEVPGLEACFGPADKIVVTWSSYREGGEDTGTFSVEDGKLVLREVNPVGSGESGLETSCDVLMRPGIAMRLANCLQHSSYEPAQQIGDTSFAKADWPSEQQEVAARLVGCWRHYEDYTGNADRITLPSGNLGLSWGVNPETGEELTGMLPYNELCFDADGKVGSMHFGYDKGRGSEGPYSLDGQTLRVSDSHDYPDGWLFGSRDATCTVYFEGDDALKIEGCGEVLADMRFVRTVNQ